MSEKLTILNKEKIAAMKSGDRTRKDILVLIINEVNNIAKNDTKNPNRAVVDDDVITALNRTIKKARETRDILVKQNVDTSVPDNEIAVAQSFLPQQMGEDEIRAKIVAIVGGETLTKQQRGLVMKTFNTDHKGEFDSALLNKTVEAMTA